MFSVLTAIPYLYSWQEQRHLHLKTVSIEGVGPLVHVSTIAQNGQTQIWPYRGWFMFFESFTAMVGSPAGLEGEGEQMGYSFGCNLHLVPLDATKFCILDL